MQKTGIIMSIIFNATSRGEVNGKIIFSGDLGEFQTFLQKERDEVL